jgi:hypothetical protein
VIATFDTASSLAAKAGVGHESSRRDTFPSWLEIAPWLVQAGRTPARRDPLLGIDVDRDRPKPTVLWPTVPVLIKPPHVAAILDNHIIEPVLISRGRQGGPA